MLVGCANVIDMAAAGDRNTVVRPILHQLFEWYQNRALPDFTGAAGFYSYLAANSTLYSAVASSPAPRSTLCHDSVSQWCTHTNNAESSAARSNRCGLLTAEAVYVTAKLLCWNANKGTAPS